MARLEDGEAGDSQPTQKPASKPDTSTTQPKSSQPQAQPVSAQPGFVMPVAGGRFTNDWGNDRDGGARSHEGTDIFAPAGTAIVAPVSGTIVTAGDDGGRGGVRAWLKGDDGRWYYFAHMQNLGVKVGDKLSAGAPIGTVGTSGNAEGTEPHLHFGVTTNGQDSGYINPHNLLTGAEPGTPQSDAVQAASFGVTPQADGTFDPADLRAEFGWAASLIDVVPEVGELVQEAAREGYDENRLIAGLMDTDWWKATEPSIREWDYYEASDPAGAKGAIGDVSLTIRLTASRMGIPIDDAEISKLAKTSLRLGWTDRNNPTSIGIELQRAIAAHIDFGTTQPGSIDQSVTDLRSIASSYLIPASDKTLQGWTQRIANGETTPEAFAEAMRQQAVGRFPNFATQIEQGITPEQLFDSYKGIAASTLEMDEDQIDLMSDPRFSQGLDFYTPGGERRAMTLNEWQTHLRGLPEWRQTENGQRTVSGVGRAVAGFFGEAV